MRHTVFIRSGVGDVWGGFPFPAITSSAAVDSLGCFFANLCACLSGGVCVWRTLITGYTSGQF